jgi:sugar phosphate isomerase/epimerase
MKFGVCAPLEEAAFLKDAGYDYIELTVVSLMPEKSDEECGEILRRAAASPLPAEAFNVFLPGDLKITGPEVDEGRVERYLRSSLKRVADLGGRVVVFGSGGARRVPDGFPQERAWEQLRGFLHKAADCAEEFGVVLAIEPLNTKECNIINSVSEAVRLSDEVNRPSVKVLADMFHMVVDGEPLESVTVAGNRLAHVHVADTDRLYPGSGRNDFRAFFRALKSIGYDARVSIECRWGDFKAEAPKALEFLREQWASA